MENLNLNRLQWQALKNARAYLRKGTIHCKHRMRFTANLLGGVSSALELAEKVVVVLSGAQMRPLH
jgi:hypothetical protein